MRVENLVDRCVSNNPGRPAGRWIGEVVHRFTLARTEEWVGEDDVEDAARFLEKYPGVGSMAYTFGIKRNGLIQQALPIDIIGWHARTASRSHLGIAVFGDFRTERPTDEQWESLVWLLTQLSLFKGRINFCGHDANPMWSWDKTKECPGNLLNIDLLHDHVRLAIRSIGREILEDEGVVIGKV